ncbi:MULTISPECIES: BlaI/MecI/CopY family transcriptional regulator [Streptomyces]|uniref:BlaI/MecI/CopY family transcriptional regulator n=1 Tax=Streptomyces TaxID=1883 RepID=UPI001600E111|nr:BlaI/MecI/CopY family transcriptional regulator [Streptomyces murinus]MBA9049966.1 putative transcriptional regulator [Streptomyces murinus]
MRERGSEVAGEPSGRRARGELESSVLAVLWAADRPLTARQVLAELPGDLAYTTVLTILSRLHDKGMLVRRREGRGHACTPARDEASDTAARMRTLLDRDSDRDAVLARFVSGLSAGDGQLLQRLLTGPGRGRPAEES